MEKVLISLNRIASYLEKNNEQKLAEDIHNVFLKLAKAPEEMEGGHKSPPKGYPKDPKIYADEANFKYPLDTEEHVRAAWSYIHQERNRKNYSADELTTMENKIRKYMKKYDIEISEPAGKH
jgi:hypothetical protein